MSDYVDECKLTHFPLFFSLVLVLIFVYGFNCSIVRVCHMLRLRVTIGVIRALYFSLLCMHVASCGSGFLCSVGFNFLIFVLYLLKAPQDTVLGLGGMYKTRIIMRESILVNMD